MGYQKEISDCSQQIRDDGDDVLLALKDSHSSILPLPTKQKNQQHKCANPIEQIFSILLWIVQVESCLEFGAKTFDSSGRGKWSIDHKLHFTLDEHPRKSEA